MNTTAKLATWALVAILGAAGGDGVLAQTEPSAATPAGKLERPMLPLPPTVFWRHALLTPQPGVVAAEAAARAAAARQAGDAASEARWITVRASALHELPGLDDASLSRAWQLASSAGDLAAAADAHLELGLRAYRARDPLAAGTHADGALRAAQEARDKGRVLASLALQGLNETPKAGESSLLEGAFGPARMQQFARSMLGLMSWGRNADAARKSPLRERLLSAQAAAPGSGVSTLGLPDGGAAWLGLIDGYQAYAEEDLVLAEELWRAQAQPSTRATDERVRGLAWLAIAWLNMSAWADGRDGGGDAKAKRDRAEEQRAAAAQTLRASQARDALQQARAAFARAGVRSGEGQTLLLLSEFGYITGRHDEARVAAEQAGRIYSELGHEAAVLFARLLSARGEERAGQRAAALRETEAGEALLARSMRIPDRVPPAVVSGLVEQGRILLAAATRGAFRAPDRDVAVARGFLRWARGTGEPLVQLLALDHLSSVLAAAGYREDAVFYRMLHARGHETYREALSLEVRLRRAAMLDYDLLVADGGANLASELKMATFDRIEKALLAVLEAQRVLALDPRIAEAVGMSTAEIERAAQLQKSNLERLLQQQRSAAQAFIGALAGEDRRIAARHYVELMRRVGAVRDETQDGYFSNRSMEQNFTRTQHGQMAGHGQAADIKGRVVASYRAVLPSMSAAETLHTTAFDAYERDVMVAGLLREPQRALNAAKELASFYSLYRGAVRPSRSIDFPTMFQMPEGEGSDASRRMVPLEDKSREQLLNKGITALNSAYIDRLVQQIDRADPDIMTGMSLLADEGARFVRDNFDVRGGLKVVRNEVRDLGLNEEGRRRIEIDHEYTHSLVLRPNADIVKRPEPAGSPDLTERRERLDKDSSLGASAAPVNWSELVSGLTTLDALETYSQQLLGVSLAASQQRTSVFGALLTPAFMALSRTRSDDLTLPPGMLDFAAASAAVRQNAALAAVYSKLGATVGSISEDDLLNDPESLGKALAGLAGGLTEAVNDSEGPVLEKMRGYLEGGLAQLIAYPELGLVLTGDEKGAREFFARQQSARMKVAELPGANLAGVAGTELRTPRDFERGFSFVLHHLLQGQWKDAVSELDALRRNAGEHMPVAQYQLALIAAICHGRLGDAARRDADLTVSRETLDRVRTALRSRELARPLGLVRRAIYEQHLALLYASKDFAAMELALARYKVATVTPVATVRSAGEVATALGEARYHFDAVSRMTRNRLAQIGAVNPLALALADENAPSEDTGRLALTALNHAAHVLLAEAGRLEAATPALKLPAAGTMTLSYFVGTRTSFVVARSHAGPPVGYRIDAGADEIERRALQFRRDISGRKDISVSADALYRLLVSPVENLRRANQLLIWPDGALGLLPFQALRRGAAGPYLVESASIAYVTGTAAPGPGARLPAAATELLVLGNPDGTLDSAESEARELASLEVIKVGDPLMRSAGTLANLARRLPTARSVHFATHGVFSESLPNFSYLVLSEGQRLYSLDLGGLDFSGRDIYLSACETRLGVPVPGDDVYGLADAFLSAGASSVVATLWRIESDASALFAKRFYEQKSGAISGPQSLALTAREFIHRQRWLTQDGRTVLLDHPYFWAAYGMLSPAAAPD